MDIQGVHPSSPLNSIKWQATAPLAETRALAQKINEKLAAEKNQDSFTATDRYTALYMLEYEQKQAKKDEAAQDGTYHITAAQKEAIMKQGGYYSKPDSEMSYRSVRDFSNALEQMKGYVPLMKSYDEMAADDTLSAEQRGYAHSAAQKLKTLFGQFLEIYEREVNTWSIGNYLSELKDGGNTVLAERITSVSNRQGLESLGLTGLRYKSADEIERTMDDAVKKLNGLTEEIKKASGKGFEEYQPNHMEVSQRDIMSFENSCMGLDGFYQYSFYGEQMRIPSLGDPIDPSKALHTDIDFSQFDLRSMSIRRFDGRA